MTHCRLFLCLCLLVSRAPAATRAAGGMLVAAQVQLHQDDYRSEAAFGDAIARVLAEVRRANPAPQLPALVVFPECIGLPLVTVDHSAAVFAMPTMDLASAAAAAGLVNEPGFAGALASCLVRAGGDLQRATGNALLAHAGRRALEICLRVFGRLAREHRITLCAGSLLCPRFTLVEGAPRFDGSADVYNTVLTFGPDGRLLDATRKVFPTRDETGVVTAAPLGELQAFETPLGRAGVLVCADGWFPACYRRFREQEVQILLQPSMMLEVAEWNAPWRGYSGWPAPADVDPRDIGRISEGQAWERYALQGRIAASGARYGVNVFAVGQLWEHRPGGLSRIACATPGAGHTAVVADDPTRPQLLFARTGAPHGRRVTVNGETRAPSLVEHEQARPGPGEPGHAASHR